MSVSPNSPYVVRTVFTERNLWKQGTSPIKKLTIELTERCNNNCIQCYINIPDNDPAKKRELSTDKVKSVLNEAAALGCMNVMYTGGEPLLRDDFEELYNYTRKLGMTVTIRTNATLITPTLAKTFARIPPMTPIAVTAYGIDKTSYEAVTRTPGSFAAFMSGLNLLAENSIPFQLTGTMTSLNIKDIDRFDEWLLKFPTQSPPTYSIFIDLRARREPDKNRILASLRLSPEEALKVIFRRGDISKKGMLDYCARYLRPRGDRIFSCGACIQSCYLDAYGNLQPCVMLKHPDTICNINNISLRDAMTKFFPKVRELMAINPDYLSRCSRCFLNGLCEMCPAKSWLEHGTLDTPVDYQCQIAHAQARYLGLITEGENAWEITDWKERINKIAGNN